MEGSATAASNKQQLLIGHGYVVLISKALWCGTPLNVQCCLSPLPACLSLSQVKDAAGHAADEIEDAAKDNKTGLYTGASACMDAVQ